MAHTPSNPQVPQHVNALLSHLTSRPGVQSTFILSRKDGSIIQSTGLHAPVSESVGSQGTSTPTTTAATTTDTTDTAAGTGAGTGETDPTPQPESVPLPESSSASPTPYQPSHAEALAAHIFGFVSSASDLSASLSRPPSRGKENGSVSVSGGSGLNGERNGEVDGETPNHGAQTQTQTREEEDAERIEKEEGLDDVKLLRFRSKRNEVVVVPDRKYILCVVHDAGGSVGGGGAAARGR